MPDTVLEPSLRPRSTRSDAETCRMFESDFLERFSRIHPATPFVVWLPVAAFVLVRSAVVQHVRLPALGGLFLGGMLTWTLAEYVLHRYVFHWTNETAWGKRLHFLLHGVHHDFPSDKDRLVMPLPTSVPLAVFFFAVFTLLMGSATGEPFFAGFVVGYLFYDGTHYYVHHFVPSTRWGKLLRRHHLTHHHADHDGGFGVSTPLWDVVFQTLPAKRGPASGMQSKRSPRRKTTLRA
ncbi:MAG: sterol desaturase family protein [Myxococcota bacterium]|nr:sterol desaturase family protein [Myxococcota bacterium]